LSSRIRSSASNLFVPQRNCEQAHGDPSLCLPFNIYRERL